MNQSGDIPAVKDVHYLVQELDKLAAEPMNENGSLPVVLLSEKPGTKLADAILSGYRSRLFSINKTALVPHAFITESIYQRIATNHKNEYEQTIMLLDEIVKQFQASTPKEAKRPRMRHYRLLRTLLDAHISSQDSDDQKDDLRLALYEKWRQRTGWASWLKGATADVKATDKLSFSIGLLSRPAMWFYEQHLAHDTTLQWFCDEVAKLTGMPAEAFLRSGVDFVLLSRDVGRATAVPRLLILAILRDLDEAVQGSKSQALFVLIMQGDTLGIEKRLLEILGEILQETQNRSLLFFGATQKVVSTLKHSVSYSNIVDAANNLESIRQTTTAQRSLTLLIELSAKESSDDSAAKRWLSSHMLITLPVKKSPKSATMRKVVRRTVPVVIVLMIIVASLQFFAPTLFVRCSYAEQVSKAGVETVGVIGDTPQVACSFANDLRSRTDAIVAENKKVDSSGEEFATVIFLAPLTVPIKADGAPADGYNNQSIKWQLDGVLKAQQRLNEKAAKDKSDNTVRMKVLVANVGSALKYGTFVVDKYLKQLLEDSNSWNIIGVAGIAESRSDAQSTITSLLALPRKPAIIGSTSTGDTMSEQAYMITADNHRQGSVAAEFIHYQPIAGTQKQAVRNVFIIKNSEDTLYSQNLADRFKEALMKFKLVSGKQAHATIDVDYTDKISPKDVAQDLCSSGHSQPFDPSKDVIYFAGRSSEATSILTEIDNICTPGSESITVVGGSDMAQYRDYESTPAKDSLYYVSFAAAHNQWNKSTNGSILSEYIGANDAFKNENDFSRAHDNIYAFGEIANSLKEKYEDIFTNRALDPATKAATYLNENMISFPGISGYINIGESQKRSKDRPVIIRKAGAANRNDDAIEMVCGTFDSNSTARTWYSSDGYMHDCLR
jgi:hypothetical protein